MDYLKKVVPKMFQNTLSNLSTPVIQQFLDELSFREMFGHYPLACFDALLARISAQTQVNTCPTSPPLSFSSSWTSSPSGRCLATIHLPVLMLSWHASQHRLR
jgi:hypothetical protein